MALIAEHRSAPDWSENGRFVRGSRVQSTALDNGRLGRLTLCQLSYSRLANVHFTLG
jgi:hypothetical protein